MKLLHLSDLHLGKRVNEFPMLEDQTFILDQILRIVCDQHADAVLIAGDIYDKPVPGADAVALFDRFLSGLAAAAMPVFLICGNHDSPERLAFGAKLFCARNVFFSPLFDGTVFHAPLRDEFGETEIWLLPFLKPLTVRRFFPETEIASTQDAVRAVLAALPIDPQKRNVLLAHQFVTGAVSCESEELSVGGEEQIDGALFDAFDYVALGHLHGPQKVVRDCVRYCGSPLQYSFSEVGQQKSVTVVELGEKGCVRVSAVPLCPLHKLRELRGAYMELTDRRAYEGAATDDYLRVTLTDEDEIPDAIGKLRAVYPNIMRLCYDNQRTRAGQEVGVTADAEKKTPLQLFQELFVLQNNQPMSPQQTDAAQKLIEHIWKDL